jgi:glyoxylase-like metal-dependent hydrolase (beta-lactamase superfamily II)
MRLHTIETGFFKLDGGAMFGVVPKVIWDTLNKADANNLCTWAMRCLLVESDNRLILIDTGIGNKQSEKFFSFYHLHGNDTLEKSLAKLGYHSSDITDVILTHLHFDHCGGCVTWNASKTGYMLAFPNATYRVHRSHWEYALAPNAREKASFLSENLLPMYESGHLSFFEKNENDFLNLIKFKVVNGHTGGMIIPIIEYAGRPVIFCADLIPSSHHVPVHYVMGYDVRPLESMTEKQDIMNWAVEHNGILFFEHDPQVPCALIEKTERGFKLTHTSSLKDLVGT